MQILLQLFLTFVFIGILNFGGGYAMIAFIQNQVVDVHGWLTLQEYTDMLAISQSTPGPVAVNTATYTRFVGHLWSGCAGLFHNIRLDVYFAA